MDFKVELYCKLLVTLKNQGFLFSPVSEFIISPINKVVVLRHDVDRLPLNSLDFARIEAEKGIKGTYYFRTVHESFDPKIIKEIYLMGHEIGYHYEDLGVIAQCHKRVSEEKELVILGIERFKENLSKLREIVPVNTICMHGSPMSKWDSRLLWNYYDYHDFNLISEPYFDINLNEVLYLTDTGRRWDGNLVNIRDKTFKNLEYKNKASDIGIGVKDSVRPGINNQQEKITYKFHTTFDIIHAAEEGRLPDKIMMTIHPQRWSDKMGPWIKELVWQNVKNMGKYILLKFRN